MEEDNDGKILIDFRTLAIEKLCSFEYEQMMPFLRFLDKYARKIVNGDEMKKWRIRNVDKTLLHKLTPADVAYATLTYENKCAVWTEDLVNRKNETTHKEAKQKYHIGKGARVKKYCDGWTAGGRDYYKVLTAQYKKLWDDQGFHATLVTHWRRYESEHNQSTYKRKASEAGLGGSDVDEDSDDAEDEIILSGDDESLCQDSSTTNEIDDMV